MKVTSFMNFKWYLWGSWTMFNLIFSYVQWFSFLSWWFSPFHGCDFIIFLPPECTKVALGLGCVHERFWFLVVVQKIFFWGTTTKSPVFFRQIRTNPLKSWKEWQWKIVELAVENCLGACRKFLCPWREFLRQWRKFLELLLNLSKNNFPAWKLQFAQYGTLVAP